MINHKFNTRCSHCAGPLSKEMETSEWTVAPLIRDTFSMIGTAVGGTSSAFYGFNHEKSSSCCIKKTIEDTCGDDSTSLCYNYLKHKHPNSVVTYCHCSEGAVTVHEGFCP